MVNDNDITIEKDTTTTKLKIEINNNNISYDNETKNHLSLYCHIYDEDMKVHEKMWLGNTVKTVSKLMKKLIYCKNTNLQELLTTESLVTLDTVENLMHGEVLEKILNHRLKNLKEKSYTVINNVQRFLRNKEDLILNKWKDEKIHSTNVKNQAKLYGSNLL